MALKLNTENVVNRSPLPMKLAVNGLFAKPKTRLMYKCT